VAGGGDDPGGYGSSVYGDTIVLGGGRWVIYAPLSRRLTLWCWKRRLTTRQRVYGWWRTHLPPMRLIGGRRHGGLPIYLIKVADLGFLLSEDGDLPEAGPS
jgi:hypothetical protein